MGTRFSTENINHYEINANTYILTYNLLDYQEKYSLNNIQIKTP